MLNKLLLISLVVLTATAMMMAGDTTVAGCSNRSGRGIYGYHCNGVAPNPFDNFAVEPFAGYGVVTGDGNGQWNGYGKVSFNGAVHSWTHNTRPSAPGTVNSDCTGNVTYEVTLDGGPVPDAHFDFVIVEQGKEIKGFPTDPGYAVTCVLILEHSN